jgi:hypothetical protein
LFETGTIVDLVGDSAPWALAHDAAENTDPESATTKSIWTREILEQKEFMRDYPLRPSEATRCSARTAITAIAF